MRPLSLACCAGLALILLGCGGSGTGGSGADEGTEINLGSISTRVAGASQAPVTSSAANGSSVTGIAGALFTNITLNLVGPPNLSDTRIAFSSNRNGNYEIYSSMPDGSSAVRLTVVPGVQDHPWWNPNGTKLVYHTDETGDYEINVMNSNGSGQTNISNSPGIDMQPSWSKDGNLIAFTSNRTGAYRICTMTPTGTNTKQITSGPGDEYGPVISPDGSRLVFYRILNGEFDVFVANIDGSGIKELTPGTIQGAGPTWTPDGKLVTFYRRDADRLASIDPDTLSAEYLPNVEPTDSYVTYSPDGSQLAFQSQRLANPEIFRATLTGAPLNVTKAPGSAEWMPSWSGYQPKGARTLLGTGGGLGTASAGFLFSQTDLVVNTVVVFDTATTASRVDSRVVAQDNAGGQARSLIFSITTSEGLASLKYVELGETGLPGSPKYMTIPAGTTGALISFSSSTGLVTAVIPYTASRSSLAKKVDGDLVTYEGPFEAVWVRGASAPRSAASVTINRKTGEVTAVG